MQNSQAEQVSLLRPEQALHAPTGAEKRQATVDLAIRILIWATIAAVVAISAAVGLFVAQQLLGAMQSLAFPMALVALVWAGYLQRRVHLLKKERQANPAKDERIGYQ